MQLHQCSALIQHESRVLRLESVAHLSDGEGGEKTGAGEALCSRP